MAISERLSIDLTTALGTTPVIPYGSYTHGTIQVTGASITSLTWYTCDTETGTFIAAYSSAATPAAIAQTVSAAKSYPIPADLAGARWLKCVANAAGAVEISLKAQ